MANGEHSDIFRQKSLDSISSPEELHDYVRVTNPGVWLILSAIVFLLTGFIVWGIYGQIDTMVDAVCVTDDGVTVCYVDEDDVKQIRTGMALVTDDGETCTISDISKEALDAGDVLSDYAMHVGGFAEGQWIHELTINEQLANGTCAAEVIVDSVKPISFILN